MHRWLAQLIDEVALRLQARQAHLSRRTTWPTEGELSALRGGAWVAPPLEEPGAPSDVVRLPLRRGADESFCFPSSPPYAQAHDRSVHGLLYLPKGDPVGAVVMAPGAFTGNNGRGDRIYDDVGRAFADAGIAAARLMLPLHELRSPAGEISGHNMFQGDMFTYVRAVAQGVRDARASIGWLWNEFGAVGFWGLSLGAGIGALALSHDDRLAFGVLLEPPLVRDAALRSPLTQYWRQHLLESGVSDQEMSTVLRAVLPDERPAIDASRILLQGGRWDRLAPPHGVEDLAQRWACRTAWYNDGHISMALGRRTWLRDGVAFAREALS